MQVWGELSFVFILKDAKRQNNGGIYNEKKIFKSDAGTWYVGNFD